MTSNLRRFGRGDSARRGSALLVTMIAVMVVAAFASSMLFVSSGQKQERTMVVDSTKALYIAEAGMSETIAGVRAGNLVGIGSADAQSVFAGGSYWTNVVDNGDDTLTITAFGTFDGVSRATEVVMANIAEGVYASAVFAGNSSGDGNYDLRFGGQNAQADDINGNIYSGGNILVTGHADISGEARAAGKILGHEGGEEGRSLPVPDIAGADYPNNNDFNVAALFSTATYKKNASLGGSAWQMPESSPVHIFRKNPDDRAANTAATAKDDYFLEDPYESVSTSSVVAPNKGTHITLSGLNGKPGVSGTDKVYYIDGNLWIHNNNIYSFTLYNAGTENIHVTFVVRGNIYFSDNILYQGTHNDALAMIAIKDPSVADSGNIYFGDPTFGTLEQMDAFMYAENNFYDNNLDAAGSKLVTVNGNMTAGNQVQINRDAPGSNGTKHSKLTVNFDSRLIDETLTLPGLPKASGSSDQWVIRTWREVSAHP